MPMPMCSGVNWLQVLSVAVRHIISNELVLGDLELAIGAFEIGVTTPYTRQGLTRSAGPKQSKTKPSTLSSSLSQKSMVMVKSRITPIRFFN
jgi:hypothetical protein